ncbi:MULTISPECIES: M57 family metalloprotease [Sphingobacterium]|uniref:M57 family metalloprotease n=1 Tax=Sphingobacterium TaxID=28453 RepID=UPI00129C9F3A|nr:MULTISPECIES: M57 family metalloprotease [Sphingobacterium]MCS4164152.1 putative Zn-dependent protease [Sphingobacterium sp. BIGb0116]
MKRILCIPLVWIFLLLHSCNKADVTSIEISQNDVYIEKLKALGFDLSQGFYEDDGGFIVENDIFLSKEDIDYHSNRKLLEVVKLHDLSTYASLNSAKAGGGKKSQYRTTNIVSFIDHSSYTKTISLYLDPSLNNVLGNGLDQAITRYNNLDIALKFIRVQNANVASIRITPADNSTPKKYLMKAGFPQSSGAPYNSILVNTNYYNNNTIRYDIASTLAHEIGHCIGLRHTDYMNRVFSCGAETDVNPNEGSGTDGAVHIPGTPTIPEYNSFMLACTDGVDRPFTQNDILALKTLYPLKAPSFYVALSTIILEDRSSYSSCCDYNDYDVKYEAKFYKDQAGTTPYYPTSPFVLRGALFHNNSFVQQLNINIPTGVQSYDLGTYTNSSVLEWGTTVSQDEHQVIVYPSYDLYLMR